MYLKKIHGWMYWILAIVLYFAKQYHASLGNIRWLAVQSEVFNRINHSIISLLLAGFIMGLLILIAQRKKLEEKDRLNQRLLKMQTEQWKRQNESQKELRAFRHDFSAHVQALDILSKQKDYEKLNAYIQKFGEIRESVFYISTNHIIGDAIVNEYYRRGREDGTAVTVVGRFPDEMKISDMDLCILLSNLMSNAWKAAQEACGERQIQMKIGAYDEKVFITVWNPVNSAPVIVDGMIQRPERKEDGHGFGIENMKKALTPYGGMIRWEVDDEETNGIFVITKVIF